MKPSQSLFDLAAAQKDQAQLVAQGRILWSLTHFFGHNEVKAFLVGFQLLQTLLLLLRLVHLALLQQALRQLVASLAIGRFVNESMTQPGFGVSQLPPTQGQLASCSQGGCIVRRLGQHLVEKLLCFRLSPQRIPTSGEEDERLRICGLALL